MALSAINFPTLDAASVFPLFADLRDPSVVDALAIIFDPSQVDT